REWLENNLKLSERFGEGETYTEVERSYDRKSKLVTEMFTQVSSKGQRAYLLRYRLFDQTEIKKLLSNADLVDIIFYGGYERISLSEDYPMMVVSARKRAQ
ncbi:hypothetical protein ACFLY4_09585, partial [Chloroflexota bacterium]